MLMMMNILPLAFICLQTDFKCIYDCVFICMVVSFIMYKVRNDLIKCNLIIRIDYTLML